MRRLLFIAATLWMTGGRSYGQVALGTPPPPPGPLVVATMPDMAQWSIDFTYKDPSTPEKATAILADYRKRAAQDPALAKALENPAFVYALAYPRPVHIIITKTANIRRDEIELERGYKSEAWSFGGFRILRLSHSPGLVVSMPGNAPQDLPEFNWITRGNFQGIKKFAGVDCLTFQQDLDASAILNLETAEQEQAHGGAKPSLSVAMAYIDLKTRYPMALVINNEPHRYTILAAPSSLLIVPDDVAAKAKEIKAHLESVTKGLSPP